MEKSDNLKDSLLSDPAVNPLQVRSGPSGSEDSGGVSRVPNPSDYVESFSSALDGQNDDENPNYGKYGIDCFVSSWVKDKADEYDYCMVLPLEENGKLSKKSKGYLNTLRKCGLDMFVYKGFQVEGKQTECFVLLRADNENIKRFAELISFKMEMDPKQIKETLEGGNPEQGIAPIAIPHQPEITKYEPWRFIFGRYTDSIPESLYWKPKGEESVFRNILRLKLTALLAESRPRTGSGEPLKIRRYMLNGWILGFFPLHNRTISDGLAKKWLNWRAYPWTSPFYQIKEYFGEKIALYFVFMGHYTKWLLFPAILGIPFQIAVLVQNDFSADYLPYFSFVVSLWAIVMLEFWKRKEKKYALEWGTIDFEKAEPDRPDFKGEDILSVVHGGKIKYFPNKKRAIFQAQSGIVIFLMICVVIGVVASIYLIKYTLEDNDCHSQRSSNAQTIASILNAVMIQVLNFLYGMLAKALTLRENHRTDTAYEDAMITKLFCFQFVNSYASFFYLAFVQAFIPDACGNSGKGDATMKALAINLAIVFGTRIVSGNLTELLIPYLTYQIKYGMKYLQSGKVFHSGSMSRPEKEYLLVPYDVMNSSLEDYAETAIQFGYNSLFLVSLPIASLLGLISNFVECKGDAWKIMNIHQRPVPKGCEDIGTWQTIFLTLTIVSVITNAGLICFTMDTFNHKSLIERFWVFVLFQWVLFMLQALLMGAIPDVPEEILIQQERQEFIVSKIIDQVSDDKVNNVVVEEYDINFQEYPGLGDNSKTGYQDSDHKNTFTDNMK